MKKTCEKSKKFRRKMEFFQKKIAKGESGGKS
jgi:hypothetical protein